MTHVTKYYYVSISLKLRHNGHDSVSNHQPHDCLLNRLFRRRSKKISKLRVTGLRAGKSPETGEFPAQMASYAENVSTLWRHHVGTGRENYLCCLIMSHLEWSLGRHSGVKRDCNFLVATKQLYEFPVCLSVRPSVHPSVSHTIFTIFPSLYNHEICRIYCPIIVYFDCLSPVPYRNSCLNLSLGITGSSNNHNKG